MQFYNQINTIYYFVYISIISKLVVKRNSIIMILMYILQEYQVGNKTMVIDDTNIKQTVYMYKCENSTLQIKGKVNSITLGKTNVHS